MAGFKVGIVGLPNAGKSTLFNALVFHNKAAVGVHPFTTIEKNIGVVEVPDDWLFKLAKAENINKVTPSSITFVDIAGLIKGAHQGEGLGNQFLHYIREVDLILHVLRFFKNEEVPHVHPRIDPEEDLEIVNEELLLADIETLEKKMEKEKITSEEKELIKKLLEKLNQGIMASEIKISKLVKVNEEILQFYKGLNLLTAKKQLIIANISEGDIGSPPKKLKGEEILSICAKLEADLNELPWIEAQQFLRTYGLSHSAKERLILACYQALDLITFYTVAKKTEAKAWPVKKGTNALTAAAKIHTDFAKNFIKVEVINTQELLKIGSWQKAKQEGKLSLHGKDYLINDKDVLEFKVALKAK